MSDFLASSNAASPETFTPDELFAGTAEVTTDIGKLVSGQNLAKRVVLGRITASGKLTQWTPGAADGSQVAVGILVHAVDASGGDKDAQFYRSGVFNIDALGWGAATTAQKYAAFNASDISVRALPGSTTVI